MDRTKEKVYGKQKLWKIFTLKRPQFLQKMLAIGVSASLMLSMAPKIGVFAEEEPTTFIAEAKANHWGRSDLRAYLNGVEKVDNTLPIDTTTSGSNATGYASQFSADEYALVQPFTYSTNVLNSQDVSASTYSATDRFWLPSGNISSGSDKVLSWGATDVSLNSDCTALASAHAIPISYWPAGASSYSWLRSPYCSNDLYALKASRGYYVDSNYVNDIIAAAAAFKLDLSSVIFASAASAASLAADGGSRPFKLEGSSDFGKKTKTALPDYGMYLKTSAGTDITFTPGATLTYAFDTNTNKMTLTVPYTGGVAGQYVVAQAFKEDNLGADTTFYAAAKELAAGQTLVSLDVPDWTDASGQQLATLDGYTIKVWMEDASGGSSLAAATAPVTFVGSGGSITKTETGAVTNQRVFAMKNDLQTSWGDLQALKASNETAYNNVIAGNGQDGSEGDSTNSIHGLNPTNQKIYFGTKDGSPLEFWIAGRETYAEGKSPKDGDGTIEDTGEIMTLYQAKSVERVVFKASYSNYTGNSKTVTLRLTDEQTAEYTGSAVAYPEEKITATVTDGTIDKNNLVWQHREKGATAWTAGMPTDAGTYDLRCYAPGVPESYERTYGSIVTFNIKYKPKASDFTFTQPADLTYDGNQKIVTVTGKKGMGAITVKYYKKDGTTPAVDDANDAQTAPTDVGTYAVKIDVAEGELYAGAEGLDGGWTFTISYLTPPELSGFSTDTGYKDSENLLWFKGGAPASITPPSGYEISTSLNGAYGASVQIEESGDMTVHLKNDAGQMTDEIDLAGILKWDSDAPTGNIQLSTGNYWTDLINKISFGLFFKDAQTATITASDSDSGSGSGIKSIEYHVATNGVLATKDSEASAIKSALGNLGNNDWTECSSGDTISLTGNSKNVVYAKLTDNVGNISYISSDGIVLYSDSEKTTSSLEYTKLSDTKPEIKINLKGNTIKEVKLDGEILTNADDYSVSTQGDVATISLVASELDKEDAGDHTVKVSFKSLADMYPNQLEAGATNEKSDDVTVPLTITKATPTADEFTFSPPDDLTYNGQQKEATVTGQEGMDAITVKYYKEDGSALGSAPKDVGTYAVKIDVAEGDIYAAADGLGGDWTFTINKKSLAGAKITIDPSSMVYTGKTLEPKITSVTVDGISVPSDAYRMKVSGKKQAGQTVTVTLTAKSNSNFKGSSKTTFTITKAAPNSEKLNGNPTLEATYGQTLGDIKAGLASAVGSFLDVDGNALKGVWAWEKDDATKVGNVGENKFTAIFTPTDGNYAKTTIDVTVKVSVDTSKWGDAQKRDADGKTQYVDSSGKTSIEMAEGNLSAGDVLWLLEESGGTHAWYGIDLSSGAFDLDKGLRFYVQWLSPKDADYNTYYSQLDDAQKARVEGDNGWIFLIGVEDPDGNKVQPAQPAKVYVQLGGPNEGADWDLAHLKAYYITSGGDENVPVVDVSNFAYPGGTDEFGMMTLSHFSPYFIFDELTDEERAALGIPSTGDISTELLISGLAIVLVSSLGVMLRLITSKKKFEK